MQFSPNQHGYNSNQEIPGPSASTTDCILKFVLFALGLSVFLQTGAIIAPGWIVRSVDGSQSHHGLFYYVYCGRDQCDTKTYADVYFEKLETASKLSKIQIRREYILDTVHYEVGATVAWTATLIPFIILAKKYVRRELVTLTLGISASAVIAAGFIMGGVIYNYLVETGANVRLSREDSRTSVVFPYSLFLYILACVAAFVSVVALFRCLYSDLCTLIKSKSDARYHGNEIILMRL